MSRSSGAVVAKPVSEKSALFWSMRGAAVKVVAIALYIFRVECYVFGGGGL